MLENREAVKLFDIMGSQIQYAPDGNAMGIPYAAIDFVFDLYEIENRRKTFEKILILQRAMIDAAKGR